MVATLRGTTSERWTRPAFIDCDHHNELDSEADIHPYLPKHWLEHIRTYGLRSPAGGFYPRFMGHREDARPPSGRKSGSEARYTVQHFMDPENCAYAILIPLAGVGGIMNAELGAAWASAVNDWQVAEWLDVDPRFRASIQVPFEDPPRALEEIERRASDKRFVQVQFSGRPHEPMGRRKYWPIYEACAKHGLHVVSHAFGSYGQPITGTGWPSFYVEEHVGPAQAIQANVTSMAVEGVFEHFPSVRLVSTENGFFWMPSLCWRLDNAWSVLKSEVPHLKRAPSEYVASNVYVATQPMEEPHRPGDFLAMLEHGNLRNRLMFASDYPHWDADDPDGAFPIRLTPELAQKIYFDNAAELYGLA